MINIFAQWRVRVNLMSINYYQAVVECQIYRAILKTQFLTLFGKRVIHGPNMSIMHQAIACTNIK